MARVTLTERPDSRRWSVGPDAAFELKYNARGSSDPVLVKRQAVAELPLWWEGLQLVNVDIDPNPEAVDSATGVGIWLVVGSYKPPTIEGVTETFDTTGGTFHITQSLKTIAAYALSGEGPTDHKGAINADGEKVEGVDITVPVFNFSESYRIPAYVMTPSYKGTLFNLTGKTNDAKFRGFKAEEVLFLGATGSKDSEGFYQVEYKFSASPELSIFQVGDITVELKRGWHYLWVTYEKQVDEAVGKYAQRPAEVHIERVYLTQNFTLLGIGTGLIPVPPA